MASLPEGEAQGLTTQDNSDTPSTTTTTPTVTENRKHTQSNIPLSSSPFSPKRLKLSTVPLLLLADGDTLVYFDPAPGSVTTWGTPLKSVPHRVHSEKLLASQSPFFIDMFNHRYQTRIRKRRDIDELPDGIKYVLDLSPPTVDDDALIALAEVSCPMSIRTWALQKKEWDLPDSCVGGEDDMEPTKPLESPKSPNPWNTVDPQERLRLSEDPPESFLRTRIGNFPEQEGESGEAQSKDPKGKGKGKARPPLPTVYSYERHQEGIENVLRGLEGLPAIIDTPCKLWAYFASAKIMGVATNPAISGSIVAWFYEGTNTRFIELHPEIAYVVACTIESASLCHNSFASLVGDEALLHLVRSARIQTEKPFEKSRFRDVLQDIDIQRVEYASKSFLDTMITNFLGLTGVSMSWLNDVREFSKLTEHASKYPEDADKVGDLITSLKSLTRTVIYRILQKSPNPVRCSETLPGGQMQAEIFANRDLVVRIMNRKFWTSLATGQLKHPFVKRGAAEMQFRPSTWSIGHLAENLFLFRAERCAMIGAPAGSTLADQILQFNNLVKNRSPLAQPQARTASTSPNQPMNLTINLRNENSSDQTMAGVSATSTDQAPSTPTGANSSCPIETTLPYRPAHPASNPDPQGEVTTCQTTLIDLTTEPQTTRSVNTTSLFSFDRFKRGVEAYFRRFSEAIVSPSDPWHAHLSNPVTDVVTCLSNDEWKYLPLWASGNDDGSGGVFTDHNIPNMQTGGFSTPGPAIHTGSVASTADSFTEVRPVDAESTVQGASHHATQSHFPDAMSLASDFSGEAGLGSGVNEPNLQTDLAQPIDDVVLATHADDTHSSGVSTAVDPSRSANLANENLESTPFDDVDDYELEDDYDFMHEATD